MHKFISNYLKGVSTSTVVLPSGTIVTDESTGKLYVHDGATSGGVQIAGFTPENTLTWASNTTWDLAVNPTAIVTLTNTTTITIVNGVNGRTYYLSVVQDPSVGGWIPTISGATLIGTQLWQTATSAVTSIELKVSNGVRYFSILGGLYTTISDPPNPIYTSPTGGTINYGFGITNIFKPASSFSGVNVAWGSRMISQGTAGMSGSAHTVGGLAWNTIQETSGTLALAIGGENKVQIDNAGVTVTTLIASENQVANIVSGATVSQLTLTRSHVVDLNGTMTTVYGHDTLMDNNHSAVSVFASYAFSPPTANNAAISYAVGLYMPSWGTIPGSGSITSKYFFLNSDSTAISQTAAPILSASGQELAGGGAAYVTGRYVYGWKPSGVNTGYGLTSGLALFAPLSVQARTTFTKIGCHVTVAVASTNVQFAIYKFVNGVPSGSPIYSSGNVSVAATGDVFSTGQTISLEAGIYGAAVNVSAAGVSISFSQDTGSIQFFGSTTLTGGETTVYSSMTFGTWTSSPTLSYAATYGAAYVPLIAVAK
jgi:hypothetical protein